MDLFGQANGDYPLGVPCKTNTLDHPGETDFDNGAAEFTSIGPGIESPEETTMMGTCYQVIVYVSESIFNPWIQGALNAELVDGGSVEWKGEGTWSPKLAGGVCVDWGDAASFAWNCDLVAKNGEPIWELKNCARVGTAPNFASACP